MSSSTSTSDRSDPSSCVDPNRREEATGGSTSPSHVRFVIALEPLLTVLSIVFDLVKVILLGVPLLFREIYSMFVPRPQKDVRGQVVLVTGGGNGLGRAMAQLLAARGCHLVLVDIDLAAAERTAEEIKQQYGVSTRAYRVDVSKYDQCHQLAASIERDGAGPVDILINNAGLIMFAFINDSDVERANSVMDVNMKSHIWMTKVFLDGMIKRKRGHIVGISSMSGMYAFPWGVVYSATKFAVSGFMASLTEQLRIQGISKSVRTTCVNPYYVTTRKDVVEFLQKPRFAPLTCDQAAREIVKGILREDIVVTVPRLFGVFTRFMLFFPVPVQQLVRDYLIREYELNNNLHT
ncbi:17-beta-hydroxysteroid dehydrogenase 13-like [Anopheles stephensi]|uniref:17-beta-hydroxysteroid dehydrogenase 13-like n=1 Tax=Anopheles stephensi TaxID=30069 RepID=UPI0016588902|nr:17-beta-hydroxysteroid dehydrogenase 13-like [Anopheles stephensi]XP_035918839.1 17-beta-hydroxysteroid dehydrogenase 13-like [Anopheles stephensi]